MCYLVCHYVYPGFQYWKGGRAVSGLSADSALTSCFMLGSNGIRSLFRKSGLPCGLFLLLTTSLILDGCSSGHHGRYVDENDSIVFRTGFPCFDMHSGVISSGHADGEIIYFANLATEKKLLFFTPEGSLVDSTQLTTAMDHTGPILGLEVLARDSILLSDRSGFTLTLIDRKGHILQTWDLASALRWHGRLQQEMSSFTNSFVFHRDAFFHVALVADSLPEKTLSSDHPFDAVYDYYKQRSLSPFLVKLNLDRPESALSWGVDSFYYKIDPKDPLTPETGNYTCLNGSIFVYSMYSPWVIVVDPTTLREVTRFKVRSDLEATFVRPIQMAGGNVPNYQDSVTTRERRGAYLVSMHQDQPTGYFLLTLAHALKADDLSEAQGGTRMYSLLIYDKAFRFIGEMELDCAKYDPYFILSLKKGSYIRRNLGQRMAMLGVQDFDRLHLDEKR